MVSFGFELHELSALKEFWAVDALQLCERLSLGSTPGFRLRDLQIRPGRGASKFLIDLLVL